MKAYSKIWIRYILFHTQEPNHSATLLFILTNFMHNKINNQQQASGSSITAMTYTYWWQI
jgi:hypothetical protein